MKKQSMPLGRYVAVACALSWVGCAGGETDGPEDTVSAVDTASVPLDVGKQDSGDAGRPQDVTARSVHQCTEHSHCAYSDKCAGEAICDKTGPVHVCRQLEGSAVVCDPAQDTACVRNRCHPKTGECGPVPSPAGTPCKDDDPCTVDSSCVNGKCVGGEASWCQCQTSEDCALLPGFNPCNGTVFCDKTTSFPWTCRQSAATAVQCPASSDPCQLNACDGATGKCALKPAVEGTPCDDGKAETKGDVCVAGACKPGVDTSICAVDADCDGLEDGDACNGTLYCNKLNKHCEVNPATIITCPTGKDSECKKATCSKGSGACELLSLKNGTACNDGDACTAGDICKVGACTAGTVFTCPCHTDGDCVDKDDGNLCNGGFFCDLATKACAFQPLSIIECKTVDDTACTKNACDPKTGKCLMVPAGESKDACHQFAGYLRDYAADNDLDVRTQHPVTAVQKTDDGFVVHCFDDKAGDRVFQAPTLVNATGYFAKPRSPRYPGSDTTQVRQMHVHDFKSAARLHAELGIVRPKVLVVGRRVSAGQTMAELHDAGLGFEVMLSARGPVRYSKPPWAQRLSWWGFYRYEDLLAAQNPLGLDDTLPPMEGGRERELLPGKYVRQLPDIVRFHDQQVEFFDGTRLPFDLVIYATGFVPALDHLSDLVQTVGGGALPPSSDMQSTQTPGLYFIGLDKQRSFRSRYLRGIREDAKHLARLLLSRTALLRQRPTVKGHEKAEKTGSSQVEVAQA